MPGQKLDEIDRMILAELQADGRRHVPRLAARPRMPHAEW